MKTFSSFIVFASTALVLIGCSTDAPGTRRSAASGSGANVGSECDVPNLTQRCTSCGEGSQVCTSAKTWSECRCDAPSQGGAGSGGPGGGATGIVPAGNLDQAITFDWPEAVATGGTCEAGRYEGSFDGTYCFSVGGGFGGVAGGWGPPGTVDCGSAQAYPIQGLDPTGAPGITFDLTKSGSGEILMINGGKFQGTTNGFIPFHADLANGKLDCSSAKFTADIINGEYTYAGQVYKYEGHMTADYDKATHSLINGTWEVWEPATFDMMGTGVMAAANWGKGTWTAMWVP